MKPFVNNPNHPSQNQVTCAEQKVVDTQNDLDNQGVVYTKTLGNYEVHTPQRVVACTLSSRLHKQLSYPTADPHSVRRAVSEVKTAQHSDPVAVGDRVRFIDAQDNTGMIVEVLPRSNKLARRSAVPMPGAHPFEQVIVANIDQVIAVFAAANPAPKWNLLDRYLVSAEAADIPALICITKLDLATDDYHQELDQVMEEYRRIGYPVQRVSAVTGQGLDGLKQAMQGRSSVLLGKSGVGKTSLLNALQPGLGLRIKAVSQATGKGRHTTTHLEMFSLDFGGAVVDTPGLREFGLWEISEDDLALFFSEMRPLVGRCKFGLDCQHDEEPGCAIRKAVVAGQISPHRYRSYLTMREDP